MVADPPSPAAYGGERPGHLPATAGGVGARKGDHEGREGLGGTSLSFVVLF